MLKIKILLKNTEESQFINKDLNLNILMAGDERIELPSKVLETPILPLN